MNVFVNEIVTPAAHLPITTSDPDLAAAVVEEIERTILWRAIVRQERRILIDGPLKILELEPVTSIVSLTRWTPADPAEVINPTSYSLVSRDPSGALIAPAPGHAFPAPLRPFGSFTLTYVAGWTVTAESSPGAGDAINLVPASIRHMVSRAIAFRGGSGLGDITIGSLKLSVADSYSRPGLFAGKP